ncbi:MAG: hypothetical protein REI09_11975 [Candidatus Dactylopiibacterium sp.]|nr:hypothetical protein [Candidatus Dactylopiibacterium sp.]
MSRLLRLLMRLLYAQGQRHYPCQRSASGQQPYSTSPRRPGR